MIELPVIDRADASEEEQDASTLRFWRSKSHLEQDEEFKEIVDDEFMLGASKPPSGASRRQFLQLMGASVALAGLSACRKPAEKILPYTRKPEEVIPGLSRLFATAMPFRGSVRGLLVESHEERPTKVEGNPDHPMSLGSSGVFAQASILNLYDPDRSKLVRRNGEAASWQDFVSFAREMGTQADGMHLAVLAEPTSSPTLTALREQLEERFGTVSWVTYAAEGENPVEAGMQQAFGRRLRPLYRFSEAEVIVSLDADFLSPTKPDYLHNTIEFAQSRKLEAPDQAISRLYAADSTYSLTGGKADNRLRMRASDVPALAAALASALGIGDGPAGEGLTEKQQAFVDAAAQDLQAAGSRGVILAGETQPPEVHALCAAVNGMLDSYGQTVVLLDPAEEEGEGEAQPPQAQQLADLVQQMRGGQVDALLMLDTNPVYNAPAELDFASALEQVPESIHLDLHVNETAQVSSWHLPRTHYLEQWGDGRAYDGTLSVIQPLIAPLYEDARSELELVDLLAGGANRTGYDIVREAWRDRITGDFEDGWRRVLHDGLLPDSQYPTADVSTGSISAAALQAPAAQTDLEVVFRLDPTVLDGRYANNAWCQELPDPVTKITWDNVAIMSPATAEELDVSVDRDGGQYYADLIELTVNGQTATIPVWTLPGHPDGSISVTLGYGRNIASYREEHETWFFDLDDEHDTYGQGALGNDVGTNVAPLRSLSSMQVATDVQVSKVGERHMVATTQDHGALDIEARPIVRKASLDDYREDPNFVEEQGEPSPDEPLSEYPMLWEEDHPRYEDGHRDGRYYEYQWGMTIDLNTCTGCNACVVACQSENNIQVVGKEEVARNRWMHWLRVDRYFVSSEEDADEPEMVMQPLPCMHCENAPCEPVCPVYATTHSSDGINEMTYNRCIGTRYCSNNCPYKVRHFNFFDWAKSLPLQVQMSQNPNVTVRSRGVMEKCTYCVQRVREANRQANIEDRVIRDGEVQTACQQACPADAITFGNVSDPDTKVSTEKRNSRNYEMLAYLNTQPRTSYLALVNNPNSDLEEA